MSRNNIDKDTYVVFQILTAGLLNCTDILTEEGGSSPEVVAVRAKSLVDAVLTLNKTEVK